MLPMSGLMVLETRLEGAAEPGRSFFLRIDLPGQARGYALYVVQTYRHAEPGVDYFAARAARLGGCHFH